LPLSSGFPNPSFSFLSKGEAALKRPGCLPDALWHGLQTATCRGALSAHGCIKNSKRSKREREHIICVTQAGEEKTWVLSKPLGAVDRANDTAVQPLENICTIRLTKERGRGLLSLYRSIKNKVESF